MFLILLITYDCFYYFILYYLKNAFNKTLYTYNYFLYVYLMRKCYKRGFKVTFIKIYNFLIEVKNLFIFFTSYYFILKVKFMIIYY